MTGAFNCAEVRRTEAGGVFLVPRLFQVLDAEDPLADWCRQVWGMPGPDSGSDAVVVMVEVNGRWLSRGRSEYERGLEQPALDTQVPPPLDSNPALRWDGRLRRVSWQLAHDSAATSLVGHHLDCTREWVLAHQRGEVPFRVVGAYRYAVYLNEVSRLSLRTREAELVQAFREGPTVDVLHEAEYRDLPGRQWCSAGPGGAVAPCSITDAGLEAPAAFRAPEVVRLARGL